MSYLYSLIITSFVAIYLLIIGDGDYGIYFLPMFLCGTLMGKDIVDWMRSKIDILDPTGLLAIVGYIYFFISPILQIHWDYWPGLPSFKEDSSWITLWAFLNLAGVTYYRVIIDNGKKSIHKVANPTIWHFNPRKFYLIIGVLLFISGMAQMYVYAKFGGISGFIQAFTLRQELSYKVYDPLAGLGVPVMIAESFNILLSMAVIYFLKDKPYAKNLFFMAMLGIVLFAIFIIFGGLRGSRGNTVYSLFFLIAMYHFWIQPITKKIVVIGLIFLSTFMTTYYWYKFAGSQGFQAIFDKDLRESLTNSQHSEKNKFVMVRDFGRMDFQAYTLKTLTEGEGIGYSYGRSYLTSPFSVVPKSLIDKPASFTKEKTELLYGPESYIKGAPRQTTLLLGQFGEMFVNFSYFGVILFFIILAHVTSFLQRSMYRMQSNDIRMLVFPIIALIPIQLLMYDANILVMFFFKKLLLPVALLMLAKVVISTKQPTQPNQ